jgi:K+/H+ antiporter YhaU regulatory subunit KhtT
MSLERIEQFIEHQKEEERLQKEVLDKTMYYTRALTANKSFKRHLPTRASSRG